MSARVTVLCITYNHERYIARCIESVLAQTFADWELVVADDGSSDRTCEIAESFRDDRIRVLRLPHRGVLAMRDTYAAALAASTAPLLAILDGDDYWHPNRLAEEVPLFEDRDVVMVFAEVDLVDGEGRLFGHGGVRRSARGKRDGTALVLQILRNRFFQYSVTVLVRRDAIETIGGFVQPAGVPLVDVPTWLSILPGRKYVGLTKTLAAYRVHSASVCRTMTTSVDEGQMRFATEFLDRNWRRLGLTEEGYGRLARELTAAHTHRRAVALAHTDWPRARALFAAAARQASPMRKLKVAARWLAATLRRGKVTG